jgi:hypothetical protein
MIKTIKLRFYTEEKMKAIVKTLTKHEDLFIHFTSYQEVFVGEEIEVIGYNQHLLDDEPQEEVPHIPSDKQNNYFMQEVEFAGHPFVWIYHKDWLEFVDKKEPIKIQLTVGFDIDVEIQDDSVTVEQVIKNMTAKFLPNITGVYITGYKERK